MKTNLRIVAMVAIASLLLQLAACAARPRWRGDEGAAYDVLNRSTMALLELDPEVLAGPFGSALRQACAVFVFPGHVQGAPASAATRGDGVLLVRDRSTGHWSGPVFYALRRAGADGGELPDGRGRVIVAGCGALRRLADAASASPPALDDATLADMTAWTLSPRRADPVPLRAIDLRPLPVLSLAFYQAPASLSAITLDRTVRNDASGEILAVIERAAH